MEVSFLFGPSVHRERYDHVTKIMHNVVCALLTHPHNLYR